MTSQRFWFHQWVSNNNKICTSSSWVLSLSPEWLTHDPPTYMASSWYYRHRYGHSLILITWWWWTPNSLSLTKYDMLIPPPTPPPLQSHLFLISLFGQKIIIPSLHLFLATNSLLCRWKQKTTQTTFPCWHSIIKFKVSFISRTVVVTTQPPPSTNHRQFNTCLNKNHHAFPPPASHVSFAVFVLHPRRVATKCVCNS